jgi:2-dehydro-3-deoxygluconokinase
MEWNQAMNPVTDGNVVCFGELLMRLSPGHNELLLQSPNLRVHFGGAEANVAASLAILGHRSVMVSTLPDNALGHACTAELKRLGVHPAIRHVDGRMGLYFLSPGAMHRPADVLYDRANSAFALTHSDAYDWSARLAGAKWLHLSGINLALAKATADAAWAAAQVARGSDIPVSFDCNYRSKLWGDRADDAPSLTRRMAAEATVLIGNDRDIAMMLGATFMQEDAGERFAAAAELAFTTWPRLRWMIATERLHHSADQQDVRGLCATRDGVMHTRWCALPGIVDRIGTGDAFTAGFLHRLLSGATERDALEFAFAAFCLKHSVSGDVNLLGESDMRHFMAGESFDVRR